MSALFLCTNVYAQKIKGKSEKSFSKIVAKEGTRNETLTNDFGKKWKMRVNFPEEVEASNTLVIALHWAGGGDTFEEFNDCLALPGLQQLNAIIVSPEGENQLWSTPNNVDKILSIIANATKYWNVDPDKIAVMGYSNGGNGSWYFAEKYPELFSAAIPMASAYAISKKITIPIYAIHGKKDELFSVTRTEKWVNQTKRKGTDVSFVVAKELSHYQACAYIELLNEAGEWLENKWKEQ
ncbi:dienelactone hydrolase family protein [Maribacter sp.]|nr:dienelactone hydrolase family protein [Maribacter sp.]